MLSSFANLALRAHMLVPRTGVPLAEVMNNPNNLWDLEVLLFENQATSC